MESMLVDHTTVCDHASTSSAHSRPELGSSPRYVPGSDNSRGGSEKKDVRRRVIR